jgi:hypothetical protein
MHSEAPSRRIDSDRAGAWITFAVITLLVAGTANVVSGIAAIDESEFFARDASYFFGDLQAYGYVALGVGIFQVLAAVGIWARTFVGVWFGVLCAGVSAMVQLLMIPAHPLWSLAIFALDVAVLHALLTHGELD